MAHSRSAEAIITNRDLYWARITGMAVGISSVPAWSSHRFGAKKVYRKSTNLGRRKKGLGSAGRKFVFVRASSADNRDYDEKKRTSGTLIVVSSLHTRHQVRHERSYAPGWLRLDSLLAHFGRDEAAGVYRGPLLVWFGFFTTRFLGVGVGLGMFCVVRVVTGDTLV